ncbi:hypothetical protein K1T71_009743 [Dendrolimus kikuchii]|uniref:Uncharacterized protein n=1 Tax=Dendrolimus kikuchii TaxID=765133 RepID=A0ACC1CT82_9NEOP|nr:hypothetical protein K1T71_009743 [Dendrolimus kikuchii]
MTTFQSEDCQSNDLNELFPMSTEMLQFPLDNSMQIVFTGYFNGFNVEVRSVEEIALLHHMGCFGKGSASRSQPKIAENDSDRQIMRKRQFFKRNYWYKKFNSQGNKIEADEFLISARELAAKIGEDSSKDSGKDVIDLVSSDDEDMEVNDDSNNVYEITVSSDKTDHIVIVPNSDSEEDDYFANLKPKCCINKIKIQEKLILSLEESFFLIYGLGCLQIVNTDNSLLNIEQCWTLFDLTDKKFIKRYVVYHYFKSKGYVVKPGIKFGGDFLLYVEGPSVSHADYIVIIKSNLRQFEWVSLLGHIRMATTTVKEILIVEVIEPIMECVKLPDNLSSYSVRVLLLNRHLPVSINNTD